MLAVLVNVLLIGLALASIALLVDCGLRWWSAFGALRRQLANAGNIVGQVAGSPLPEMREQGLRPAIVHGGYSRFGRNPTQRQSVRGFSIRAAA